MSIVNLFDLNTTPTKRIGISFRHAYSPNTLDESQEITVHHQCLACGSIGQFINGDLGPVHKIENLLYYKVAAICNCGFMNFIHVQIKPEWTKQIPLEHNIQEKAKDWRIEELGQMAAAATHKKDDELLDSILAKTVELCPNEASTWYNSAVREMNKGTPESHEKAIDHFKTCIGISNEFYSAYKFLGDIYYMSEYYDDAKVYYKKFLEIVPISMKNHPYYTEVENKLTNIGD